MEVTENQGHSHSVRVWATQVRSLLENRIAKTTAVDGGATLGPHLGNAPDYRIGMPRKWLVSAIRTLQRRFGVPESRPITRFQEFDVMMITFSMHSIHARLLVGEARR